MAGETVEQPEQKLTPSREQTQQERLEILKIRTDLTQTVETALGPRRLQSRDDTAFEGFVGGAQFTGLKLIRVPKSGLEDEQGTPAFKIRVYGYARNYEATGIVVDTNGLQPAVLELSLHRSDPTQDKLNISPGVVTAFEYALSPRGVIEGAKFFGKEPPTQEEAEVRAVQLQEEYRQKYKKDFDKAIRRTPTLNDYRVFGEVSKNIKEFMRIYGPSIFQAMEYEDRPDKDHGNPFGPLKP